MWSRVLACWGLRHPDIRLPSIHRLHILLGKKQINDSSTIGVCSIWSVISTEILFFILLFVTSSFPDCQFLCQIVDSLATEDSVLENMSGQCGVVLSVNTCFFEHVSLRGRSMRENARFFGILNQNEKYEYTVRILEDVNLPRCLPSSTYTICLLRCFQ